MASRGDVLVFRRRIGFESSAKLERFVVLQSNSFRQVLNTVFVAPLDEALDVYDNNPLAIRISGKEAGTSDPQVVLPSYLTSAYLSRFEPKMAGRFSIKSLVAVDELLRSLLDL
ncbi:type II toxin-antitoxin system PemK/MazF family toxin [Pendulispora brunnea]|uniref:Type II toxin-antitoxin system PemK/MazF family toxin n=1 Tax=Pendulispora brunnea TaxID=2905690 RepID=A0ABZ2K454_9BACT